MIFPSLQAAFTILTLFGLHCRATPVPGTTQVQGGDAPGPVGPAPVAPQPIAIATPAYSYVSSDLVDGKGKDFGWGGAGNYSEMHWDFFKGQKDQETKFSVQFYKIPNDDKKAHDEWQEIGLKFSHDDKRKAIPPKELKGQETVLIECTLQSGKDVNTDGNNRFLMQDKSPYYTPKPSGTVKLDCAPVK